MRESWWGGFLRVSYHKIPYEVQVSFILRCLKFPLFWGWDTRPWLHSERDLARAWHLLTPLSRRGCGAVLLDAHQGAAGRLCGAVHHAPGERLPRPKQHRQQRSVCVCQCVGWVYPHVLYFRHSLLPSPRRVWQHLTPVPRNTDEQNSETVPPQSPGSGVFKLHSFQ